MFSPRWLFAGILAGVSGPVLSHSFGVVYTLPIPVSLYLGGASAALLLSFVVAGIFLRPGISNTNSQRTLLSLRVPSWMPDTHLLIGLRIASVGALLLAIATGFFGKPSPYANFNMTWFWIIFALAAPWLAALTGDFYRYLNPWRVLADWLARPFSGKPLLRYPAWLGYWPALPLYAGFVWLELLGSTTPRSLSCLLLGYTVFNLAGAGLVGRRHWFRHVEFFGVIFALFSRMAPCRWALYERRLRLIRLSPLSGGGEPISAGLLVFLLFVLAATAFDGLHETVDWRRLYWVEFFAAFPGYFGENPVAALPKLISGYKVWQTLALLLSPLVYLLCYGLTMHVMARIMGNSHSTLALACRFAPSLIPIALVYHVSHYYTLLETQGIKILALISDPFGAGWNLFGTARWFHYNIVPTLETVWNVQVGLIVAGHVAGVVMAHRIALELWPQRQKAVLSQLPLLGLMLVFTVAGLWILSRPIAPP